MTPNDFIASLAPLAQADHQKSGVLASVTIAQACLESSYGGSELATKANNLFGMKLYLSGKKWARKAYTKRTVEHGDNGKAYDVTADFRSYDNWAESVADHSEYLTTAINGNGLRYKGLTKAKTPRKQLEIIKAGGYATDTEYVEKVMAVIKKYSLTQYDKTTKAETGEKKMNKRVFIGVGHGGSDPGAVGYVTEADANLTIALKMQSELKRHGVTVGISRTKDENDPVSEEIKEANAFGADVAVDVHNNAGGGDGFEVLHQTNKYKAKSKSLATSIEAFVKKTGQKSRGLKTKLNSSGADYFGFLRQVDCPAVILEGFFVDNKADAADYDTEAELHELAVAYAKGILSYLNIAYTTDSKASAKVKVDTPKAYEKSAKGGVIRYVTNCAYLNMRVGAGTAKTIIKTLPKNTAVKWFGGYTMVGANKWAEVKHGEDTGFVNAKYLRV